MSGTAHLLPSALDEKIPNKRWSYGYYSARFLARFLANETARFLANKTASLFDPQAGEETGWSPHSSSLELQLYKIKMLRTPESLGPKVSKGSGAINSTIRIWSMASTTIFLLGIALGTFPYSSMAMPRGTTSIGRPTPPGSDVGVRVRLSRRIRATRKVLSFQ